MKPGLTPSGSRTAILHRMADLSEPVSDLEALIADLSPEVRPGRFVFVAADESVAGAPGKVGNDPWLAWVDEPEGASGVMREEHAIELGLPFDTVWAWITLGVHSDPSAVGLTAVISAALADLGLSCNVIAGLRHDHLLVPYDRVGKAMEALRGFSAESRED